MSLRDERIIQGKTQRDMVKRAKSDGMGFVDRSLYSKFENGHALPIPALLRSICSELECDALDIYTEEQIDLLHCINGKSPCRAQKQEKRSTTLKTTVRFPSAACTPSKEALKAEGYKSANEFFVRQSIELNVRHRKANETNL